MSFIIPAERPRRRPALRTLEGAGFEVRRAVPGDGLEAVGPFIFLDHFGPVDVPAGAPAGGAPWHPHAGIETLSYLLEGRNEHRDSLGNASAMGPGEAQWMRAGRGVLHDEGPDAELRRTGGSIHGFQLWINMPKGRKHEAPAYRHYGADAIPQVESVGARLKIIAGEFEGRQGPVDTFGKPLLAHLELQEGAVRVLELPPREAALYVATGAVRLDGDLAPVSEGFLVLLTGHDRVEVSADTAADLLLLGGETLDAPIVRHGPFVMNEPAEIAAAIRDLRTGRMGRPWEDGR